MPAARTLPNMGDVDAKLDEDQAEMTEVHELTPRSVGATTDGAAGDEKEDMPSPIASLVVTARQASTITEGSLAEASEASPDPDSSVSPDRKSRSGSISSSGKKRRKNQPVEHSYMQTVNLGEDATPDVVEVCLNVEGQHLLSWPVDITIDDGTLPAGTLNLYLFPGVTRACDGSTVVAEGDMLNVLQKLIIGIVTSPKGHIFDNADVVGALPMHALTVSNSPAAIETAGMVYKANPQLICQLHVKHRAGFPLFTGESALHICAVNQQEELLCELVDVLMTKLPREEAKKTLRAQAAGVFFNDMPMQFYGGTALSYACCFDLRNAILKLCSTGLVSLNDRQDHCVVSGFLPIHAVTANSLESTFDFITQGLPEEYRAKMDVRSCVGRILGLNVHNLLPMQLAAKLGDHDFVKFMLRKQCSILWIWGPVTMHSINLAGIDSANEGGGDIMDLVARVDACTGCQELLLQSFMQGLINDLFLQKWSMFGYKLHYIRRSIDFLLIVSLCCLSMGLKASIKAQEDMKGPAYFILVLMLLATIEEALVVFEWVKGNRGEEGSRLPLKKFLVQLNKFCRSHAMWILFVGYISTAISCIIVIAYKLEDPIISYYKSQYAANYTQNATQIDLSHSRRLDDVFGDDAYGRRLKAGGGGGGGGGDGSGGQGHEVVQSLDVADLYFVGDTDNVAGMLWITMGVGLFANIFYFNLKIFTPFEQLNIFQLSVLKILQQDLLQFLMIFGVFMANFYFTLYVMYPRAENVYLPFVMRYNRWYNALDAMLNLGFTGSPPEVNMEPDNFEYLSWSQLAALSLWFLFYFFYILYSIILLLNLLIAMLSFTFDTVRDDAERESRVAFAQAMQRLELLAGFYRMPMKVGEQKGNIYTYDFRSIGESVETPQGKGSNDPFAPSDKSAENRQERLEEKVDALQNALQQMQKKVLSRLPAPSIKRNATVAHLQKSMQIIADQANAGDSGGLHAANAIIAPVAAKLAGREMRAKSKHALLLRRLAAQGDVAATAPMPKKNVEDGGSERKRGGSLALRALASGSRKFKNLTSGGGGS